MQVAPATIRPEPVDVAPAVTFSGELATDQVVDAVATLLLAIVRRRRKAESEGEPPSPIDT